MAIHHIFLSAMSNINTENTQDTRLLFYPNIYFVLNKLISFEIPFRKLVEDYNHSNYQETSCHRRLDFN